MNSQHAVVTGSSSGIGFAIAQALLDAGWRVTGLDIAPATITHVAFTPVALNLADGPAVTAISSILRARRGLG